MPLTPFQVAHPHRPIGGRNYQSYMERSLAEGRIDEMEHWVQAGRWPADLSHARHGAGLRRAFGQGLMHLPRAAIVRYLPEALAASEASDHAHWLYRCAIQAEHSGQWEAAQLLVEAGVSPFVAQQGRHVSCDTAWEGVLRNLRDSRGLGKYPPPTPAMVEASRTEAWRRLEDWWQRFQPSQVPDSVLITLTHSALNDPQDASVYEKWRDRLIAIGSPCLPSFTLLMDRSYGKPSSQTLAWMQHFVRHRHAGDTLQLEVYQWGQLMRWPWAQTQSLVRTLIDEGASPWVMTKRGGTSMVTVFEDNWRSVPNKSAWLDVLAEHARAEAPPAAWLRQALDDADASRADLASWIGWARLLLACPQEEKNAVTLPYLADTQEKFLAWWEAIATHLNADERERLSHGWQGPLNNALLQHRGDKDWAEVWDRLDRSGEPWWMKLAWTLAVQPTTAKMLPAEWYSHHASSVHLLSEGTRLAAVQNGAVPVLRVLDQEGLLDEAASYAASLTECYGPEQVKRLPAWLFLLSRPHASVPFQPLPDMAQWSRLNLAMVQALVAAGASLEGVEIPVPAPSEGHAWLRAQVEHQLLSSELPVTEVAAPRRMRI